MHTRTFEYENMTINVHYEQLPTKEDLEEVCNIFYRKAIEDKRKMSPDGAGDKD